MRKFEGYCKERTEMTEAEVDQLRASVDAVADQKIQELRVQLSAR